MLKISLVLLLAITLNQGAYAALGDPPSPKQMAALEQWSEKTASEYMRVADEMFEIARLSRKTKKELFQPASITLRIRRMFNRPGHMSFDQISSDAEYAGKLAQDRAAAVQRLVRLVNQKTLSLEQALSVAMSEPRPRTEKFAIMANELRTNITLTRCNVIMGFGRK
jgi:hypothetical protein